VNCHEQVYATTVEELKADLDAYPHLAQYGRSTVFGSPESLFAICDQWKVQPFDPEAKQPLESDIPALILMGEYDPTTPVKYGQQVHEQLGNSHLIEFAGQGHAPSWGTASGCAMQITLDFLDNLTGEPDNTCAKGAGSPPFVIVYEGESGINLETFSSAEYGLSGLRPSGWQYIGSGFYNRHLSGTDVTQIGMQNASVSIEAWLDWLMTEFQHVGLDKRPQAAGEHQANGWTWSLYTSTFQGDPVDLALVEVDSDTTILVVMVSEGGERESLYQALFLPVIEALRLGE
jgi:hypothetical protein